MKFGESNESKLLKNAKVMDTRLNDPKVLGIDRLFIVETADERTKQIRQRVEKAHNQLARYKVECDSSKRAKIRRYFGRSGSTKDVKRIAEAVDNSCGMIYCTSQIRGGFGLLSQLAYNPDLSQLGQLTTALSSTDKWIISFQQPTASSADVDSSRIYLLKSIYNATNVLIQKFGITFDQIFKWWRDPHLDRSSQKTWVWNDMRAIAWNLVPLLEYTEESSNFLEAGYTKLSECILGADEIARAIIKLVDSFPKHLEKIRPCVELLVPVLFLLYGCIKDDLKMHRCEITTALVPIIQDFNETLNCLKDELPLSTTPEGLIHSDISRSGIDSNSPLQLALAGEQKRRSSSQFCYTVQEMKRLGLDEIELDEQGAEDIGEGSFGQIRKYRTHDGARQYAVKILRTDRKFDDDEIWSHLRHEAWIWRTLNHKNINKLVGFCTLDDSVFPSIVMELCDVNLDRYCNLKPVDVEQKLNFMLDIASGLEYLHCHEKHYVHGDLRVQNVLVRHPKSALRPYAVLTDFGEADATQFVASRICVRTNGHRTAEEYLAPELFTESPNVKVSTPADIYAFGCVFAIIVCNCILYKNSQNRLFRAKERKELPVPLEMISEPKYGALLCNLWDANPKTRLLASLVVGTLRELIVDARAFSL